MSGESEFSEGEDLEAERHVEYGDEKTLWESDEVGDEEFRHYKTLEMFDLCHVVMSYHADGKPTTEEQQYDRLEIVCDMYTCDDRPVSAALIGEKAVRILLQLFPAGMDLYTPSL